MSALAERQSAMNSRSAPAPRRATTRLWPLARSATALPCSASGVHNSVGTPDSTMEKSRSLTVLSSSAILLGVAAFRFLPRRGRHRLIPENAPSWTRRFRRLTQRRAPARRTPRTELTSLTPDPFATTMPALSLPTCARSTVSRHLQTLQANSMATKSAGILMFHHAMPALSFSWSILAGLFGATAILAHGRYRRANWTTVKTRKPQRAGNSPRNSASKRPVPLQSLGEVRQSAAKWVLAYALEGDLDVTSVRSNEITIEWPPRSGRTLQVPEIDRAAWFALPLARRKILAGQRPLLDRLETLRNSG